MTTDRIWLAALPVLVAASLIGGFYLACFRRRGEGLPRWANPLVWLSLGVVFVILGIFLWPGFFVGTLVVFPLVWVWRPRPPRADPRTNGHERR